MSYQIDKKLTGFLNKSAESLKALGFATTDFPSKNEGFAVIVNTSRKIGAKKAVTLELTGGVEVTVLAKDLLDKPIKEKDVFFFDLKTGVFTLTLRPKAIGKVKAAIKKTADVLNGRGEGSAKVKQQRA